MRETYDGGRFTCEIKGLGAGVLLVKLSYVDGSIAVQWSEIAHLERSSAISRGIFLPMEAGAAAPL